MTARPHVIEDRCKGSGSRIGTALAALGLIVLGPLTLVGVRRRWGRRRHGRGRHRLGRAHHGVGRPAAGAGGQRVHAGIPEHPGRGQHHQRQRGQHRAAAEVRAVQPGRHRLAGRHLLPVQRRHRLGGQPEDQLRPRHQRRPGRRDRRVPRERHRAVPHRRQVPLPAQRRRARCALVRRGAVPAVGLPAAHDLGAVRAAEPHHRRRAPGVHHRVPGRRLRARPVPVGERLPDQQPAHRGRRPHCPRRQPLRAGPRHARAGSWPPMSSPRPASSRPTRPRSGRGSR